jgi:hypothetical protein
MRTTRLVVSWSAIVLMSGVGAACATTRSTPDGLRGDITQLTSEERRQLRDSAGAQMVADEVGPRVTVRADFDYAAGSRQVDATFHMYDDAYVVVGHLDGAGRLRIVFPSEPGDDGFVRGDKIYHVPTFFAGFSDEYAWRYSTYRSIGHTLASRRDSYDAGLGYIFVIASWRPMRLDRITDGNRWQTYEVDNVSYMYDPREAVNELGSLLAGDNREAYSIEYAQYTTTNNGSYAFSDFDAANSGCYGYRSSLGFGGLGHLFFSPFDFLSSSAFGFGPSSCQSAYGAYGYPYTYGYGYGYPVAYSPPSAPPIRLGPITTPRGLPGLRPPRIDGGNSLALHPAGSTPPTSASSQYRRPGLIAEDAGGRRTPGERRGTSTELGVTSRRPTIQQMIGNQRVTEYFRERVERARASLDDPSYPSNRALSSPHNGAQSSPEPRARSGQDGSTRMGGSRDGGARSGGEPSHAAPRGESTRMTPAHGDAPHGESARSAPAHSEPAARPAAPASSGSPSTKKP